MTARARSRLLRRLGYASFFVCAVLWAAYQLGALLVPPSAEGYARDARHVAEASGWSLQSAPRALAKLKAGEELWPNATSLANERRALADGFWNGPTPSIRRTAAESRERAKTVLLFDPDHLQASNVFEEPRE